MNENTIPEKPIVRAGWSRKILLILCGVIVGVAGAEIILGIMKLPKSYRHHTNPPQFRFIQLADDQFIHTNLPDRTIQFIYDGNTRGYFGKDNEVDHTTNSAGFRGSEFSPERSDSTYRIAFLGDSFTFGEGVHDPDTYTAVCHRLLNAAGTPNREFECCNFGVGGYNLYDVLLLLKMTVMDFKPDAIVVKFGVGDSEPRLYEFDTDIRRLRRIPRWYEHSAPPPGQRIADSILKHFRLTGLVWKIYDDRVKSREMIAYFRNLISDSNPHWQATRKAIREISEIGREHGVKLYVLHFPMLHQLNENYPILPQHETVNQVFSNHGFTVLDLLPLLVGMEAPKTWVHPTDHHPNELIHKITARAVARQIRKDLDLSR